MIRAYLQQSERRRAHARLSLGAFEGYGIELEYMLVSHKTLDVAPVAEEALLRANGFQRGEPPMDEWMRGELAWSHEMVSHVLELRNRFPTHIDGMAARFQEEITGMNAQLVRLGARLMPGGMHPWMDPRRETRLWPHGSASIHRAYDRVFGCRRHGFANLQSMQLNLPFAGDAELKRLHAAVRLLLPLLPGIAASSPFADGRRGDALDTRMLAYRSNAGAFPRMYGELIPDTVASREQYEREILEPMYREIAPQDPGGVLRHEWLNARAAVVRFERSAIEIRVMDMQECPRMDLALAALVADAAKLLYEESTATLRAQQAMDTGSLAAIFRACERHAGSARIASPRYLRLLGSPSTECSVADAWRHLGRLLAGAEHEGLWGDALDLVLEHGTLAERMVRAAGQGTGREGLYPAYQRLCDCLAAGEPFLP